MITRIFAAPPSQATIAPEKLFEIGSLSVTNSILYGWISSLILLGLFLWMARSLRVEGSRGPAQVLEMGSELIVGAMESSFRSRRLAVKYGPIFITFFFFILLSNWLGLLPGVGSSINYDGTPLLRPLTADFNGTLAMALFGMILVHAISIKESGVVHHLKHYFPGKLYNPATYLIAIFEIFSEFTRLISLGLRLFLNVAVGEILIGVFAYLGGVLGPVTALPFTLLEIFVGVLQAYIFAVLCISYLSLTLAHQEEPETERLM